MAGSCVRALPCSCIFDLGCSRCIVGVQAEFQKEREEFLDTIRELQRDLKLKQLTIDNFVPPDEVERVESRAKWDSEKEVWVLPRLDLAGNSRRARPVSDTRMRIPESDGARRRATFDPNPRFKSENVVALEPDVPDRTTADFSEAQATAMRSRGGSGAGDMGMGMYGGGGAGDDYDGGDMDAAMEKTRVKKERPRTATRKKKDDTDAGAGQSAYPVARGLVQRG